VYHVLRWGHEVNKRKTMLKFDEHLLFSGEYMKKQTGDEKLCKMASKRKKLSHKTLNVWQ
jgi:hypothetical protein